MYIDNHNNNDNNDIGNASHNGNIASGRNTAIVMDNKDNLTEEDDDLDAESQKIKRNEKMSILMARTISQRSDTPRTDNSDSLYKKRPTKQQRHCSS